MDAKSKDTGGDAGIDLFQISDRAQKTEHSL